MQNNRDNTEQKNHTTSKLFGIFNKDPILKYVSLDYLATLSSSGVTSSVLYSLDGIIARFYSNNHQQLTRQVFHPRLALTSISNGALYLSSVWTLKPYFESSLSSYNIKNADIIATTGALIVSTSAVMPVGNALTMNQLDNHIQSINQRWQQSYKVSGVRGLYVSLVPTLARNIIDTNVMFKMRNSWLPNVTGNQAVIDILSGAIGSLACHPINLVVMKTREAGFNRTKELHLEKSRPMSAWQIAKEEFRKNPAQFYNPFYKPKQIGVAILRGSATTLMMSNLSSLFKASLESPSQKKTPVNETKQKHTSTDLLLNSPY